MIMSEDNVESKPSNKNEIHVNLLRFERILVAYDRMEISKRALSYASYFSKVSDCEVVLVNVVKANMDLKKVLPLSINANLHGNEEGEQPAMVANQPQVMLKNTPLQEILEEMTAACKAAALTKKVTYEIRMGNPADEIINLSNIMGFDLIIMGSRRIASRIQAIGSTTRKVITTVRTPLLIVQKQRTYKDEY
jgi:nucleotide-binding universal stress UspA family protein